MADTLILGLGNLLRSDDGIGIRVIEQMQKLSFPPDVEILDGGTVPLTLLDVIDSHRRVVVVDAVYGSGKPGTVYRFTPGDAENKPRPITSGHQIGLLETLAMAKNLGCYPEDVVIFGIEPEDIGWGPDLSPEVDAIIPHVVELVLKEIGQTIPSDLMRPSINPASCRRRGF